MARYSAFLGRRVEVHYRAGDILLPASGTFVADSGRSIFLEQHMEQRGQMKQFRWEIPYQYIVRLEERSEAPGATAASSPSSTAPSNPAAGSTPPHKESAVCDSPNSAARNANAGEAKPLLPLPNRPKPA